MLVLQFNNVSVTAMRSEEGKTFSDPDVPHGTNSIYVAAAKMLRGQGVDIAVPRLTQEEKGALIGARGLGISSVNEYTEGEMDKPLLEQTEVLNPTIEEKNAEFLKKDSAGNDLYANINEAAIAIVASRKTALAADQIELRIEKNLDVPTITQEFRDFFDQAIVTSE